jgi:hypothetical protein
MAFIDGLDVSRFVDATAGVRSLSKPEFVESFFSSWQTRHSSAFRGGIT